MNLIYREPALFTGAMSAIITLATAFGLRLSPAQTAALLGLVAPGLMLLQAFITRQMVTPVKKK